MQPKHPKTSSPQLSLPFEFRSIIFPSVSTFARSEREGGGGIMGGNNWICVGGREGGRRDVL